LFDITAKNHHSMEARVPTEAATEVGVQYRAP